MILLETNNDLWIKVLSQGSGDKGFTSGFIIKSPCENVLGVNWTFQIICTLEQHWIFKLPTLPQEAVSSSLSGL